MLSKYLLNRIISYINHITDLEKIRNYNKSIYYNSIELFVNGCMRVPNSDTEYECDKCEYVNCWKCYTMTIGGYYECLNCFVVK